MLIYVQPDMKNTITVVILFCILIYIAGLSYKIIGGAALIAIPLAIIFLSIVVQPDQKLIQDYQRTVLCRSCIRRTKNMRMILNSRTTQKQRLPPENL